MTITPYVAVAVVWLAIAGTSAEFIANVHSITQCNDEESMGVLKNFVVDRVEGNNFELNGTIILKDDIPGPVNITCTIHRCMSEDKPDSCEFHTSHQLKNFCPEIGKDKRPWSSFITQLGIPKECPLRKGEYNINKYRLDMGVLHHLALSRPFRVFWKTTIRLDSPKYPDFFCMINICSLEPKSKLKRNRKS